jgi:hypothetical protein
LKSGHEVLDARDDEIGGAGGARGTVLERRGLSERIQFRKAPQRELFEQQAKANASRPRIRVGIEHVFAAQKHRMGLFVRTIGMANLAYNFTRLA